MTLYSEKTAQTLRSVPGLPSGATLRRINGAIISSWPHLLPLGSGALVIGQDGTVHYDDGDSAAGHPLAGQTAVIGSFTFTLADGSGEGPAYSCSIRLEGEAPADTAAPSILAMAPAAGATGVSRSISIDLTFSEPVRFGSTGTITLRNVTAPGTIQAFNVATDQGSGPGKLELVSPSVLRIRTTADLPPSTRVSVRTGPGAVEDMAGNALAAITDDRWDFTTQAATTAAPSVYQFGRQTPAGQAGIPATSFVADPSNHFALVAGRIVITAAGRAANLNAAPYNVTIDGVPRTLTLVANAVSVSGYDEAVAAATLFEASPGTDWILMLRNGAHWEWNGTGRSNLLTGAMTGVFSDPNSTGFATSATPESYNADAMASLSGGKVTIRPDTPLGTRISRRLQIGSNARVIFDGVDFEAQAIEDGRSLTEGGSPPPGTNSIHATHTGFLVQCGNNDGAVPSGTVIFRNCHFGGKAQGTSSLRWSSYVTAGGIGHLVIEDCVADGFFHAFQGGASRHFVVRRTQFLRQIGDAIRCFGTVSAVTGGANVPVYWEVVGNTCWNVLGAEAGDEGFHWGSYHSDFTQAGTNSDQTDCAILFRDNVVVHDVDRSDPTARIHAHYNGTNGRPDFRGHDFSSYPRRRTQGHFANPLNSGRKRVGTFYRETFLGNTRNGMVVTQDDQINIRNCLCLHQGTGWPDAANNAQDVYSLVLNGTPTVALVCEDTIFDNVSGQAAGFTFRRSVDLEPNGLGTTLTHEANFAGTNGTGGGFTLNAQGRSQVTLDKSGASALRADVAARFRPRAGSAAAGRGPY
jgi:hypothetical protein